MRAPLRRWFSERAEYVVLGVSLGVIGTLVAWWSVFARRMIDAVSRAEVEVAQLRDDASAMDAALAQAARMEAMIRGESALFGVALTVSVIVLFLLVRRHRDARDRMERQLQFTSHELKTPIAGVRALLQTLARDRVPDELRAGLLEDGLRACDRLEHLAETVLAYQRAVAAPGRARVHDGGALLAAVLAHRLRSLGSEGVEVDIGGGADVWADEDAFRVVVENLLDNAQKYGGGRVRVEAVLVGGAWEVRVHDDGRGFAEQDTERIFAPFSRGGGEGVTHGAGLGLYLSRQLARQMRGELHAWSAGEGRGATFTLRLPVVAPSRASRRPEPVHG
jgi:signal transduction histidine kinase